MTEEKRARHRRYTLSKRHSGPCSSIIGSPTSPSAWSPSRPSSTAAGSTAISKAWAILSTVSPKTRSSAMGPFCRTCSASLRDRRQPTASKRSSSTTWKGAPCSSNKAAWTHSPLRSSASCSALGRRSYATRARRFPRALRARSRAHRHPRKPARHGYIDIV